MRNKDNNLLKDELTDEEKILNEENEENKIKEYQKNGGLLWNFMKMQHNNKFEAADVSDSLRMSGPAISPEAKPG